MIQQISIIYGKLTKYLKPQSCCVLLHKQEASERRITILYRALGINNDMEKLISESREETLQRLEELAKRNEMLA